MDMPTPPQLDAVEVFFDIETARFVAQHLEHCPGAVTTLAELDDLHTDWVFATGSDTREDWMTEGMFSKYGFPESIEDANGNWCYPDMALINVPPKIPPARSIADRVIELEHQHAQAKADLQRLQWIVDSGASRALVRRGITDALGRMNGELEPTVSEPEIENRSSPHYWRDRKP
jgi:hypothetical protein